jgi:hypothetical protein
MVSKVALLDEIAQFLQQVGQDKPRGVPNLRHQHHQSAFPALWTRVPERTRACNAGKEHLL